MRCLPAFQTPARCPCWPLACCWPAAPSGPTLPAARGRNAGRLQGRAGANGCAPCPADTLERGPWWELFDDPVLNDLASQVEVSNQNVAAAVAAYAQARALVARAARLAVPAWWRWTPAATAAAARRHGPTAQQLPGGHRRQLGARRVGPPAARRGQRARRRAGQPGRPGRRPGWRRRANWPPTTSTCASSTPSARCRPRPSPATSARLQITQNRYNAGIVARTDVLQAETPAGQRAGRPAERWSASAPRSNTPSRCWWARRRPTSASRREPSGRACVPDDPARTCRRRCCSAGPTSPRPSAAWRRPTSRSASRSRRYFPSLRLTGSVGLGAASIGDLFSASALVWSLGASLAQTHLQRRRHAARGSRAPAPALDEAAARYRQTVLAAFQDVEDQLVALAHPAAATGAAPAGQRRRPTWWSSRCSTATRRGRWATPR